MTHYSENPGRPAGSRPDDDGILIDRSLTCQTKGSLPWAQGERCTQCPKTANGCYQHTIGKPKRHIPGGPGPDDALPCAGKWELFDADEATPEALSLCASCPFREWCVTTATANQEHGIWGGSTRDERLALSRQTGDVTTHEDRKPKRRKVAA